MNVDDVIKAVKDNDGRYVFSAQNLGISSEDFQHVVSVVREASSQGRLMITREHHASTHVGVDLLIAELPEPDSD